MSMERRNALTGISGTGLDLLSAKRSLDSSTPSSSSPATAAFHPPDTTPKLAPMPKTPSLFGGATPSATASITNNSIFSTPFGSTPKPTFGGGATGTTSMFGSQKPGGLFGSSTTMQQQPQQQQQGNHPSAQQIEVLNNTQPFVKAAANPQIFGDSNDKVVAHFNQVGAVLATGKTAYKDANNQLQFYDMANSRFQYFLGIGYNRMSDHTDEEGIVSMVIRFPLVDLNTDEKRSTILNVIRGILGNPQNVTVEYAPGTSFRSLPDSSTEICIVVKEAGFTVGACKVAQVFNDAPKAAQLEAQLKVDKTKILPKVGMSRAQREKYERDIPDLIDEGLWRQAWLENPAKDRLVPVVVRGWEALLERRKAQIAEAALYKSALNTMDDRIEKARIDYCRAKIECEAVRNRHKQLSYRLLRVLLANWITRRFSRQIDTDEDQIEARCDRLQAQLNRADQINPYIKAFYHLLETKQHELAAGALVHFDMTEEDQIYARKFLTAITYISEELDAMQDAQRAALDQMHKALEN